MAAGLPRAFSFDFASVGVRVSLAARAWYFHRKQAISHPVTRSCLGLMMPFKRTIQGENQMSFSRRALLKASAASAVLAGIGAPFVARAQGAEFTYKYANNLPDAHPMNVRAKEMAAAIKTETNGRVDLQIFPNNQLGSDTDMLSQIRSGGVEFFTLSGLILATLVPAASINGIGFAFPDYDTVWKAMDGDLGAYIRGEITKANLVVMDKIWDNGFRETTSSSKPINHPDDFKGFKIRVPVSPLRPRSISARFIPRCRPRWSKVRKIRWPSSRPQSSTKCRNSVRLPIICGTASGSLPIVVPGRNCPRMCEQSSPRTSMRPRSTSVQMLQN